MRAGLRALAVAAAAVAAGVVACETVDLGKPPADINACRPSQDFFVQEIWPNVLDKDYGGKRCSDGGCHGPGNGRPFTISDRSTPYPPPIPLPMDWLAVYVSASEAMNCSNVEASDLYEFPTNIRPHGGGMLFSPQSPEALAIQMWPEVQP